MHPHNDLGRMAAAIRDTAALAETPYSATIVQSTLAAFNYGFSALPVEFRTSSKPVGTRELSYRFVDLVTGIDPFPIAHDRKLIGNPKRPIARLIPELQKRLDVLGYGVDASAHRGLEKIWPFLSKAYALDYALALENLPEAVRRNEAFLRSHRLDRFSIIAADYARDSVNLYFPLRNPLYFTPAKLEEIVVDAGFGPVDDLDRRLLSRAAFVNVTYTWSSNLIERICFYLPAPGPTMVPTRLGLDNVLQRAPLLGARQFILGPTWTSKGAYTKLELDYTGTILGVFGAVMLVEEVAPGDLHMSLERRARSNRAPTRTDLGAPIQGLATNDVEVRRSMATDFGCMIQREPKLVVRPESTEDVVIAVRYARTHGMTIAARGRGHSTYGQASTQGVQLDMRTLNRIGDVGPDWVWAEAGATWREVCQHTLPSALPKGMTDYLDLSVGGVLSVGGLCSRSYLDGLAIDNVLELEVVTASGELLHCTPSHNSELFWACLGGQGQFGIICRAKIATMPMPELVFNVQLTYPSVRAGMHALRMLTEQRHFEFLEALILRGSARPDSPVPPGVVALLIDGVMARHPSPQEQAAWMDAKVQTTPLPLGAYLQRVSAFEQNWRAMGAWAAPKPWFDVFVPDEAIDGYIEEVTADPASDPGAGLILVFPISLGRRGPHMLALPNSPRVWLFDILRFSLPGHPMGAKEIRANGRFWQKAKAAGATVYMIGSLELTTAELREQYSERWPEVVALKQRFDPDFFLSPSQPLHNALREVMGFAN